MTHQVLANQTSTEPAAFNTRALLFSEARILLTVERPGQRFSALCPEWWKMYDTALRYKPPQTEEMRRLWQLRRRSSVILSVSVAGSTRGWKARPETASYTAVNKGQHPLR